MPELIDMTTIRVPTIEVELSSDNPRDPETWRTATLDAHLTARAYELLVEKHWEDFEDIARRLVEGRIK